MTSPEAAPGVNGLQVSHMSPSCSFVEEYGPSLPRIAEMQLSLQNRLSHVFSVSFRECSVLFTGDTGFDEVDPSVSVVQDAIQRAQVLKIPHHGGQCGHFPSKYIQALGEEGVLQHLLLSVGENSTKHPSQPFYELVHSLSPLYPNAQVIWSNRSRVPCNRKSRTGATSTILSGKDGTWSLQPNADTDSVRELGQCLKLHEIR